MTLGSSNQGLKPAIFQLKPTTTRFIQIPNNLIISIPQYCSFIYRTHLFILLQAKDIVKSFNSSPASKGFDAPCLQMFIPHRTLYTRSYLKNNVIIIEVKTLALQYNIWDVIDFTSVQCRKHCLKMYIRHQISTLDECQKSMLGLVTINIQTISLKTLTTLSSYSNL